MAAPMSAAVVLAALRAEGLRVVEVADWRTHNRNHKGAWGPVNGVMIHHTVTRGTAHTVALCRDGHSDLPGPLCHGVIAKDGTVYLVGWGRANHAGLGDDDVLQAVLDEKPLPADNEANTDGNRHFYGFECENLGDGEDPWPEAQLEAIERAAAAICRHHGWDDRSVIGHLEWQPGKVDPRGFTMPSMRARIHDRLAHPPNWDPSSVTPNPPDQEIDMDPIDVWKYRSQSAKAAAAKQGKTIPDAYGYLVATHTATVANAAAIKTLAGLVGKGVDTAAVVAAVERAIEAAVIDVNITTTPEA
ncbi:peptidoglycan recognition family protein [Streptomyces sp. A0642]|uniref:N-acetylmuramoyl-L-alanine amidase n=1 Tax=Streptomyces sp. A0642 TaxID=2563100 RepID=UPI001F0FB630|nr:peptidoglycan recognition family protein [Streptomyces sp. A0642]